MSESSEDKTKRRFLAVLKGNSWNYQYSVFYDKPELSVNMLSDMAKFKQRLSRLYPDQPFLIRLQELRKGIVRQVFLSIITTAKVENLREIANKMFPTVMNVKSRALTAEKLDQIAASIDKQAPHNLNRFFNKENVHRWSVLNTPALIITE
ncbi:hypothetical protein QMK50_05565 [Pseudomonas sp. P5_152]|uniref:hypothetical protein n=1 Tax=Pseudomonas sp. P5_152 TaxID=3043442 RepID=UPI002A371B31|nr:hypothetical protein [Pseudomonas sp. P5_152]MDX9664436.1 hypothetical protein [Pseudomonas sp. P5_152]